MGNHYRAALVVLRHFFLVFLKEKYMLLELSSLVVAACSGHLFFGGLKKKSTKDIALGGVGLVLAGLPLALKFLGWVI
jgi:hypothetical protein